MNCLADAPGGADVNVLYGGWREARERAMNAHAQPRKTGPVMLCRSWERGVNGSATHAREEVDVGPRDELWCDRITTTRHSLCSYADGPAQVEACGHTISNVRSVTGGGGSAPRVQMSER